MRYMVIMTPSDSRAAVYKQIVSDLHKEDIVGFTNFDSDLGKSLLEMYPNITAGEVIDTVEGRALTTEEFKALLQ